jgi:hypothetical protein
MNRFTVAALLAALVGPGVTYMVMRTDRRTAPNVTRVPHSQDQVLVDRAQLSALMRRLDQLDLKLSLHMNAGDGRTPPPTSPEASRAPAPAETRGDPVEAKVEAEQRVATLEAIISSDKADTNWSRNTETELRADVAKQASDGTTPLSVVCKNTLCRLEMLHSSNEAREQFTQHFMLSRRGEEDGDMFSTVEDQGDGKIRSVVFLAKKGEHYLQNAD